MGRNKVKIERQVIFMASCFVKACLDTVKQFSGSGVIVEDDGKKYTGYFKLYCDDTDLREAVDVARKSSSNVVMIEYQGIEEALNTVNPSGVYLGVTKRFGEDISVEDVEDFALSLPDGVYGICRMPDSFCDMQFVQRISKQYPKIRFCGGTLFALEGCHLGCCGHDIIGDKVGSKGENMLYEGCACCLPTFNEDDVVLSVGKLKQQQKKKTVMFKDLLYANGRVAF